ncbi:MAG: hypothetical protein H7A37_01040 [Chlamydiales bacterium]|nr:hypothetical protein [Chlamydiales bacterium]
MTVEVTRAESIACIMATIANEKKSTAKRILAFRKVAILGDDYTPNFLRRLLRFCNNTLLTSIPRAINECLNVSIDQTDTDLKILIFEVCNKILTGTNEHENYSETPQKRILEQYVNFTKLFHEWILEEIKTNNLHNIEQDLTVTNKLWRSCSAIDISTRQIAENAKILLENQKNEDSDHSDCELPQFTLDELLT